MSNWTHVAACFRIDSFVNGADFESLFGKTVYFHSDSSVWNDAAAHPESYLPMGSEGSLEFFVCVNPDECYIGKYVVTVYGDLRDHDSADEIIAWFDRKCEQIESSQTMLIRQAVITADNELYGIKTKHFERKED